MYRHRNADKKVISHCFTLKKQVGEPGELLKGNGGSLYIPLMVSVCLRPTVSELLVQSDDRMYLRKISLYMLTRTTILFWYQLCPSQIASKHTNFHIDSDKQYRVSADRTFLCKIKYSTWKRFNVHEVSRKCSQLSAWMLSHTRTTSG